jgi:26S proteasome regulatory subunit N8
MSVKTNDQLMSIYLSSLIRSITAFHDLIDNKIQNKRQADDEDAKQDEEKKDKDIKKEEKLQLNGANEKSDAGSKEGKAGDKDKKK